jgi:hypothetical protein
MSGETEISWIEDDKIRMNSSSGHDFYHIIIPWFCSINQMYNMRTLVELNLSFPDINHLRLMCHYCYITTNWINARIHKLKGSLNEYNLSPQRK